MRWLALLGAILFVGVAWAMLASLPSPACAEDICPPWTCVDNPSSCGELCVCNMEFDVCELPDDD